MCLPFLQFFLSIYSSGFSIPLNIVEYLGLPETFSRSKKSSLRYLEHRIDKKLNLWKTRYLSLAGKEVLIKAVIQALPTYVMSCFLLPKGTCQSINAMIARFWWRNQASDKGIHWKQWAELCKTKKDGGLGFRDFKGFNLALVGKQLWRMATKPESLLARVFKGRYFKNGSILTANIGSRPSYAWRSIWKTQPLLREGMQRNIGNGEGISTFEEPWIVDSNSQPRPPVPRQGISPPWANLSYFKEADSEEWDLNKLDEVFPEEECLYIRQIRPSRGDNKPAYKWIHQTDGRYTVKSAYRVWYSGSTRDPQIPQITKPDLSPLYQEAWNTDTAPKIRHLIWRALTNNLATGSNLTIRRISKSPDCQYCGAFDEDTNHLFFTWPFARAVWASSELWFLFAPRPGVSIFSNMAKCMWGETHGIDRFLWPWIIWCIWNARNEMIYEGILQQPNQILTNAKIKAEEWRNASMQENSVNKVPGLNRNQRGKEGTRSSKERSADWVPPPQGTFLCNTDGSWNRDSLGSGVGWIMRNENGLVKFLGAKTYPRLPSPLHTEAAALEWASRCLSNMGYQEVCFQVDCANLFLAVKDPGNWPTLEGYLADISLTMLKNPKFTIQLVSRKANKAADLIAKKISSDHLYSAYIDNVTPCWLEPIVNGDISVAR